MTYMYLIKYKFTILIGSYLRRPKLIRIWYLITVRV